MSFSYKKWVGVAVFLITVALVGGSQTTKAQVPPASTACPAGTQLHGWLWSSNIGWVSLNSEDPTSGGGPFCTVIDSNGNVVGWAWSSNIGWVKFGGLTDFPTGGTAANRVNAQINSSVSPSELVGWARACSATVNKDCNSATRTDGWDGWIELSAPSHKITYVGTDITGYAWGSDVVGWTQFLASAVAPVQPTSASCQIATGTESGKLKIEWKSSNTSLCWSDSGNFTANNTSGSDKVTYPSQTTIYSLKCSPKTGTVQAFCSSTVTVPTGPTCTENCGTEPPCTVNCDEDPTGQNPALQMWLNNSETLGYVETKVGKTAKINWRSGTDDVLSGCAAQIKDDVNVSSPDNKILTTNDIGGPVSSTVYTYTTNA